MTKTEAITRYKKLRALADPKRNSNANERKAASTAARLLKVKHGITAADLREPKPVKVKAARPDKSRQNRTKANIVKFTVEYGNKKHKLSFDPERPVSIIESVMAEIFGVRF